MAASRKLGGWWRAVLGVFFLALGSAFFYLTTLDALLIGQASPSWPTVQARIWHTDVIAGHHRGQVTYTGYVRYGYRVHGKVYASHRIAALAISGSSSAASEIVRRYPVDAIVPVYYNPAKPWISVLVPGMSWQLWMVLGFSCFFMGVGVWIIVTGRA